VPNRSHQTNLMMENLLYVIPGDVPVFGSLLDSLVNPYLPVLSADCGTTLGMPMDRRVLGTKPASAPAEAAAMFHYVFGLDGHPLTSANVGATEAPLMAIRHPAYCAHFGAKQGVCAVCAVAGLRLTRSALYNESTSVAHAWTDTNADLGAEVASLRAWALREGGLKVPMGRGGMGPFLASAEYALLNWISSTYSGGLLGLQGFGGVPLPAKSLLLKSFISDDVRGKVEDWVLRANGVPEEYADFFPRIPSNLEAVVLGALLYAMLGEKTLNEPPAVASEPPVLQYREA